MTGTSDPRLELGLVQAVDVQAGVNVPRRVVKSLTT